MAVFELQGFGLSQVPLGSIGVLSTDNERPLMNRNSSRGSLLTYVDVVSANHMTLHPDGEYTRTDKVYLGAILSADRQTVYWENTTRPLPET